MSLAKAQIPAVGHAVLLIRQKSSPIANASTSDGAGLAAGVFHHILSLKNESPKVIAATHFHEIFEQGFLKPQARLAQAHMEVRLDPSMTPSSIHEVTYLYK